MNIVKTILKLFIGLGLAIIIVSVVGCAVLLIMRHAGKSSIFSESGAGSPQILGAEQAPEGYLGQDWQDDWIAYHRGIYDYNDDIMTILVMGIDRADPEVSDSYGDTNGGQADALFLLVFNPHDESTKIIGINRNTMTDVEVYDDYGNYVNTVRAQIAVQHGFGDGREGSCELQKQAVSKLFYSLPIHGYAAVNMSAIASINDAVGGVDVTPDCDFTAEGYSFRANETVHLEGDMAYAYLHERDVTKAGSADQRLLRHKEYLLSYGKKARSMVKSNPMLVTDIYSSVEKQMTTDLSLQEVFYLTGTVAGYSFDRDSLYLMDGVTRVGDAFEEFYPDDDALIELMLGIFYEKVAEY